MKNNYLSILLIAVFSFVCFQSCTKDNAYEYTEISAIPEDLTVEVGDSIELKISTTVHGKEVLDPSYVFSYGNLVKVLKKTDKYYIYGLSSGKAEIIVLYNDISTRFTVRVEEDNTINKNFIIIDGDYALPYMIIGKNRKDYKEAERYIKKKQGKKALPFKREQDNGADYLRYVCEDALVANKGIYEVTYGAAPSGWALGFNDMQTDVREFCDRNLIPRGFAPIDSSMYGMDMFPYVNNSEGMLVIVMFREHYPTQKKMLWFIMGPWLVF